MTKIDTSSRAPVIRTEFRIEGDGLDPDEFTQLVGLQAARSGRKGDLSTNLMAAQRGVRIPQTFWLIVNEDVSYSMDEGVQKVLTQIWPHRKNILHYVTARPRVEMEIYVVIHIGQDRPVYEISRDSIRKMAELDCSFAMGDIYPLPA